MNMKNYFKQVQSLLFMTSQQVTGRDMGGQLHGDGIPLSRIRSFNLHGSAQAPRHWCKKN